MSNISEKLEKVTKTVISRDVHVSISHISIEDVINFAKKRSEIDEALIKAAYEHICHCPELYFSSPKKYVMQGECPFGLGNKIILMQLAKERNIKNYIAFFEYARKQTRSVMCCLCRYVNCNEKKQDRKIKSLGRAADQSQKDYAFL